MKNIKFYNVSFGILLFLPPGWIIIISVLLFESVFIAKYLTRKFFNLFVFIIVIASNLISGIIGFVASLILNGGWWLSIWFPWVSKHEVDDKNLFYFIIYFMLTILATFIIETLFNLIFLRIKYGIKNTILSTIIANIITNGIIVTGMYIFSFFL